MTRSRRPSAQTIAVLLALAEKPTTWRYGYELCQQLDLKAGSMYPILMRLADNGMLETGWETQPPSGRPPRHLYRLAGAGLEHAKTLATTQTKATQTKATQTKAAQTKPAATRLRPNVERA